MTINANESSLVSININGTTNDAILFSIYGSNFPPHIIGAISNITNNIVIIRLTNISNESKTITNSSIFVLRATI